MCDSAGGYESQVCEGESLYRFARREDFGFGLKPALSMRSALDRLRAIFSMMS